MSLQVYRELLKLRLPPKSGYRISEGYFEFIEDTYWVRKRLTVLNKENSKVLTLDYLPPKHFHLSLYEIEDCMSFWKDHTPKPLYPRFIAIKDKLWYYPEEMIKDSTAHSSHSNLEAGWVMTDPENILTFVRTIKDIGDKDERLRNLIKMGVDIKR